MSWIQGFRDARQLSVIESAYSQEADSTAQRHHCHISTERRDFAATDFSFSASSPANGYPDVSSRVSSLVLEPTTTGTLPDRMDGSKDIEKMDTRTMSSDGSGPKVAEVTDHKKQDPFAQESEGGMQYRTMAWWYGHFFPLKLHPPIISTD